MNYFAKNVVDDFERRRVEPARFDETPEQRGYSLQVIVADRGGEIVGRAPRPAHRGGGGGERGDPPRVPRPREMRG